MMVFATVNNRRQNAVLADKREAPESAKHSIRYKAKLYLEKSEALFITLHLVVVGSVEEKGAKKSKENVRPAACRCRFESLEIRREGSRRPPP